MMPFLPSLGSSFQVCRTFQHMLQGNFLVMKSCSQPYHVKSFIIHTFGPTSDIAYSKLLIWSLGFLYMLSLHATSGIRYIAAALQEPP